MTRAGRFARRLGILSSVIRRPGVRPTELARQAGTSERTLYRDLRALRRLGYPITYSDGYQLQESLGLDGASAPQTPGQPPEEVHLKAQAFAAIYEQQLRHVRSELPAELAEQVMADLEALASAGLAALVAETIWNRLNSPR